VIRKIKSLCTNFLARILPATAVGEKGINAQTIVRRRVEITVERETLSILVPGELAAGAKSAATVTANAPGARQFPSGSGQEQESIANQALNSTSRSDADQNFSKRSK